MTLSRKQWKVLMILLIRQEKIQKGLPEYYRNLPEVEKLKKEIILTIEIKLCQMWIEKKEEKNKWKL